MDANAWAFGLIIYGPIILGWIVLVVILRLFMPQKKLSKISIAATIVLVLILSANRIYGGIIFLTNFSSWPKFTVTRIADTTDYQRMAINSKVFDGPALVTQMKELFQKNEDVYNAALVTNCSADNISAYEREEKPIVRRYLVLDQSREYGSCTMDSMEVYDLSTGEMIGISRVFNGDDKAKTELINEVFPRLKSENARIKTVYGPCPLEGRLQVARCDYSYHVGYKGIVAFSKDSWEKISCHSSEKTSQSQ